ncbi:MAG: hypothetical protein NEA02_03080 [Thermoanaerobaculia bacterium]|nr:hypothetical protein [Thermoanaerobaculia bacterium]
MTKPTRLALAVAVLTLPAGASPITGNKGPVQVHAPAVAPRLHIKSFTIVSPACNKAPEFRAEIQNIGTAFEGNKTMSPTAGPLLEVRLLSTPYAFRQGLPAVGGGATLTLPIRWSDKTTACPSDNCWELSFFRAGPGGPSLSEWDGKTARICAKTSCNPHASRGRKPCTFELYSPGPR